VLLVVVENMFVGVSRRSSTKADIIATVLFGDGSAAACINTTPPASGEAGAGPRPQRYCTLIIMGWDVDEMENGVVFDRSYPACILTDGVKPHT
jgi:alkylresorcinol/alkylpyrone synthase